MRIPTKFCSSPAIVYPMVVGERADVMMVFSVEAVELAVSSAEKSMIMI